MVNRIHQGMWLQFNRVVVQSQHTRLYPNDAATVAPIRLGITKTIWIERSHNTIRYRNEVFNFWRDVGKASIMVRPNRDNERLNATYSVTWSALEPKKNLGRYNPVANDGIPIAYYAMFPLRAVNNSIGCATAFLKDFKKNIKDFKKNIEGLGRPLCLLLLFWVFVCCYVIQ